MAVETLAIQQIGRGLFYLILAGWNAPGERLLVSRKAAGRHVRPGRTSGPCGKRGRGDPAGHHRPFEGVVLYQTHILGVSQGMPLLAYGKLLAEVGLSRQETERML